VNMRPARCRLTKCQTRANIRSQVAGIPRTNVQLTKPNPSSAYLSSRPSRYHSVLQASLPQNRSDRESELLLVRVFLHLRAPTLFLVPKNPSPPTPHRSTKTEQKPRSDISGYAVLTPPSRVSLNVSTTNGCGASHHQQAQMVRPQKSPFPKPLPRRGPRKRTASRRQGVGEQSEILHVSSFVAACVTLHEQGLGFRFPQVR
jgi:hypothetical protein